MIAERLVAVVILTISCSACSGEEAPPPRDGEKLVHVLQFGVADRADDSTKKIVEVVKGVIEESAGTPWPGKLNETLVSQDENSATYHAWWEVQYETTLSHSEAEGASTLSIATVNAQGDTSETEFIVGRVQNEKVELVDLESVVAAMSDRDQFAELVAAYHDEDGWRAASPILDLVWRGFEAEEVEALREADRVQLTIRSPRFEVRVSKGSPSKVEQIQRLELDQK